MLNYDPKPVLHPFSTLASKQWIDTEFSNYSTRCIGLFTVHFLTKIFASKAIETALLALYKR